MHVGAVHLADEIGRAKVELIVALIDEHAFGVEHRPHRAVEDDDLIWVEQALDQLAAVSHRKSRVGPSLGERNLPSGSPFKGGSVINRLGRLAFSVVLGSSPALARRPSGV